MICSERELGLGDGHDGIMVLPEDTPLGIPIVQALGLDDSVLELEIYPNRPDNQSVIGIAREVAAITRNELRLPQPQVQEEGEPIENLTSVTLEAPDLCPRYSCRVITGVTVGESPLWLQRRLLAAGMRPINNIVDITNFVMLEMGQPMHAFDYDLLAENRIVVRRAKPQEEIVTLDGVTRTLTEDMLVIADGARPQVVAGIMGAESVEVSENTVNILLEAANFNGPAIRRTSRALGLSSESSSRFEKGLDPNNTIPALERATDLILQLAGGKAAKGIIDVYPEPVQPWQIKFRTTEVKRLLGVEIPADECAQYLASLQLETELQGDTLLVTIPTFRGDLRREADLVEEIARLYGYDKIPATLPSTGRSRGGKNATMVFRDGIRELLVGFGLNEAMSYTFWSTKALTKMGIPWQPMITINNPLTEEWSAMRIRVLPQLLEAVARNVARQQDNVHLFELGPVYEAKELPLAEHPEERWKLAIAMTGQWPTTQWGRPDHEVDVFDLKGVLEALALEFGIELEFRQSQHDGLHPGRSATILCAGKELGMIGEVHPTVVEEYSLDQRVVVAELYLDLLQAAVKPLDKVKSIPRYPAVARDIALLVPVTVDATQVQDLIIACGGGLITEFALFDVYEGEQIPENYRSLAYSLIFQAPDRTLRDEEIQGILEKLEERLATELSVQIRR